MSLYAFHSCLARRISAALAATLLAGLALSSSLQATTVTPPEFPVLVNESDVVVHAVVKAVSAEKRTGPRGPKIYTRVEFAVLEVVAGTAPASLVLDFLGGRVGNETMFVEGMPRFEVGDEDILFVSGNGRSICPLYGMMHGRYPVAKDPGTGRKFVVRSDQMPLRATSEVSEPLIAGTDAGRRRAAMAAALAPADFIRDIRAAVTPNSRLRRGR